MKVAEKFQKQILKKEDEIVKANRLFCEINGIYWGKEHDVCIRSAMRAFFKEGVYPIVKDIYEDAMRAR